MPITTKKRIKRDDSFTSPKEPLLPNLFAVLEETRRRKDLPLDLLTSILDLFVLLAEVSRANESERKTLYSCFTVALLQPVLTSQALKVAQKAIQVTGWLVRDFLTLNRLLVETALKEESESAEIPQPLNIIGIAAELLSRSPEKETSFELRTLKLEVIRLLSEVVSLHSGHKDSDSDLLQPTTIMRLVSAVHSELGSIPSNHADVMLSVEIVREGLLLLHYLSKLYHSSLKDKLDNARHMYISIAGRLQRGGEWHPGLNGYATQAKDLLEIFPEHEQLLQFTQGSLPTS